MSSKHIFELNDSLLAPDKDPIDPFDTHNCDDSCELRCEECDGYFCVYDSENSSILDDDKHDPNFIFICEKCRLKRY